MTCSTSFLPNGINRNCLTALREVKTILIYKSGQSTFDNAQALDNIENMRVKIQEEESLYIFRVQGSTPTKGEINEVTSGYGINKPAGVNPPSLVAFGETNACDFAEMLKAFQGGTYECMFYGADGNLMSVYDSSDYRGFTTLIQAVPFGVADRDGQAEQFQINFYFQDADEFANYAITKVNYTTKALEMLVPVGLTMIEAVAYGDVADTVTVDVRNRCSTVELSEVLTGEVISTNVVGAVVTVVPTYNATNNNYDVVIQKGAGALATGEYVIYRLTLKSGSIYQKVTNYLKITA